MPLEQESSAKLTEILKDAIDMRLSCPTADNFQFEALIRDALRRARARDSVLSRKARGEL